LSSRGSLGADEVRGIARHRDSHRGVAAGVGGEHAVVGSADGSRVAARIALGEIQDQRARGEVERSR
jgi:hypothetical protein